MILLPPTIDKTTMALEKQGPIEAEYEGDTCDEDGNILYDTWVCPACGQRVIRKEIGQ